MPYFNNFIKPPFKLLNLSGVKFCVKYFFTSIPPLVSFNILSSFK